MKKIFCDRCGKEMGGVVMLDISQAEKLIAGIRYTLTSRFGMGDAKQYDLCPECQSDLYDWLNDGPDKVKPDGQEFYMVKEEKEW
jgi:hypothetical protein